ncbi:hypothetical protein FB451DRAFT_1167489 [Mycena latifolia]|nr:hypothetical protein FB451DRAFT_1167489 [Mycena latifolia]
MSWRNPSSIFARFFASSPAILPVRSTLPLCIPSASPCLAAVGACPPSSIETNATQGKFAMGRGRTNKGAAHEPGHEHAYLLLPQRGQVRPALVDGAGCGGLTQPQSNTKKRPSPRRRGTRLGHRETPAPPLYPLRSRSACREHAPDRRPCCAGTASRAGRVSGMPTAAEAPPRGGNYFYFYFLAYSLPLSLPRAQTCGAKSARASDYFYLQYFHHLYSVDASHGPSPAARRVKNQVSRDQSK